MCFPGKTLFIHSNKTYFRHSSRGPVSTFAHCPSFFFPSQHIDVISHLIPISLPMIHFTALSKQHPNELVYLATIRTPVLPGAEDASSKLTLRLPYSHSKSRNAGTICKIAIATEWKNTWRFSKYNSSLFCPFLQTFLKWFEIRWKVCGKFFRYECVRFRTQLKSWEMYGEDTGQSISFVKGFSKASCSGGWESFPGNRVVFRE